MTQKTPEEGDLVVVPAEPALGVGRIERFVDGGVRIHFYDSGDLLVRRLEDVVRCPPGVWDRSRQPRR